MAASWRFSYALLSLLLLFLGLTNAQDVPECSEKVPCKVGCCSKFGFCGLGPAYCSKAVCVNNCDRKADCDPGGYGKDFVTKTTCPLNVCCSKYGFCGTTSEFCGDKKVKRPTCAVDKSSRFKRVVGYYESWSSARPCNRFYPEQIPSGVYSHINFAFASINPSTFELIPADQSDVDMYRRVAYLKRNDPNLKVMIAVGGWTFNDPGPTATTFSDIARSEDAQRKFIGSVLSFLQTYNYDGIDLDWEYPGAEDRSGRGEDFANFPKFMANLKQALKDYEVSITLPASLWYLQHFDIKRLAPHVDFFNMMTYDFHGVWDKPNKWVGPYLNSHTNLTEIKEGLDLLWRNDIDHDKVTLGMAFYGRGFIATSSACLSPGCTFESGTAAQLCSAEVGVILNSEIDGLVAKEGLNPVLNKDAAVKVLTWGGNNWVTYDDEETLQMKADFARSECLGGVMVWAISHDTQDAKYSLALSRAAPRLFNALADTGSNDGYVTEVTEHPQCRWTNCNENCPANWIRMMRNDGGARGNEFMVNGAGCDGRGVHKLCCPPGNPIPTCGWYSHNNGDCDNGASCPAGTREIGSNSEHCATTSYNSLSPSYQAACCTTETDSMKLYSQCDWTSTRNKNFPNCDAGSCGADVVAYSGDGSGDATCWGGWYRYGMEDSSKNKYCCSQPEQDKNEDYQFEDALRNFMTNPVCMSNIFVGSPLRKRNESLAVDMDHQSVGLVPRQDAGYRTFVIESLVLFMAQRLFVETPRRSLIDIWDRTVVTRFNSLSYANLADYQRRRGHTLYVMYGSTQWPRYITCNLGVLQEAIAGNGGGGGGGGSCTRTYPHSTASQYLPWRAPEYTPGGQVTNPAKTAEACTYDPNCAVFEHLVVNVIQPNGVRLEEFENDHLFERQLLRTWGDDALVGRWNAGTGDGPEGIDAPHEVPFAFFTISLQQIDASGLTVQDRMMHALGSSANPDVMTLVVKAINLMKSQMWSLGEALVAVREMEDYVYGTKVKAACPKVALDHIRKVRARPKSYVDMTSGFSTVVLQVLVVWRWHSSRVIRERLRGIVWSLRQLLRQAERHYESTHGGQSPYALEHFDGWVQTRMEVMRDNVQAFGVRWLQELNLPAVNNVPADAAIRANLVRAYATLPDIRVDDFFPPI
ncbi:uncharacterized protein E0L32_008157 [Thyridium curvatum]|uniref:chitinase n=1 Tax=Thyridium curvatum TaxID=1093900 RepID=A0A507B1E6_9PEZI|nr:uncharacterized protein E0L32_008157 [Thyridium curvatum]TPX10951.1 hypothetical protein E0L32_008157 [Thyridium curvatum]